MSDVTVQWERSRWLQMLDSDGALWMETSSPGEVRDEAEQHPDWPVYRLYKRGESEYERRLITREELDADCAYEDEWYRKALGRG
ncbi:hypothetical protein ACQP1O_43025 (plasmid) [Nocardia sp. CA-151230]|uniref:hypothetical protein n=1 Tax=Nocardia sp. CA-151230 TaxID=3239982 RepID=UPI003D8E4EC7